MLPAGEEGHRALAGEQGEVNPGAQLVQRALGAAGLQPAGQRVDVLIRRDHVGGRQVPSGQRAGARGLGPGLHPGVLLGLLAPPDGGGGVDGQHRAADGGAQLPGGLTRRQGQDPRFDGGRIGVAQAAGLLGDHRRPGPVELPGPQRRGGAGQPGQGGGDAGEPGRGPAGQDQQRGDLVVQVLDGARPRGGPAAGQLGDDRCLAGRRPGRQPPRCAQQPGELVVVQAAQPAGAGLPGEPGQGRAGRHGVGGPARGEPGAVVTGIPVGETSRERLGPGGGRAGQATRAAG